MAPMTLPIGSFRRASALHWVCSGSAFTPVVHCIPGEEGKARPVVRAHAPSPSK